MDNVEPKNTATTTEELFSLALSKLPEKPNLAFEPKDITTAQNYINRIIYLTEEVKDYDDEDGTLGTNTMVRYILEYNASDEAHNTLPEERKPILLYINSPGGSIYSGMQLIDAIRCSKTPVYTIVQGQACSMAFHIAIAGHKRFAMENSFFLVHDGHLFVGDSASKTADFMSFNELFCKRLDNMVSECTHISKKTLESKKRIEWYFFADEAKKLGVIDEIITPETSLDPIL